MPRDVYVGIDLGTTRSGIACFEGFGAPTIYQCDGHDLLPSYIAIKEDDVCFGNEAINEISEESEWVWTGAVVGVKCLASLILFVPNAAPFLSTLQVAYSAKRYIGMRYSDPRVQMEMKSLDGYMVVEGADDRPLFRLGGAHGDRHLDLLPEAVSALLLKVCHIHMIPLQNLKKTCRNNTSRHSALEKPRKIFWRPET